MRGVRFNLVSPVGNPVSIATSFNALAPALCELGWHVQWYTGPGAWPTIAALHECSGLVAVLDHLAGWRADSPPTAAQVLALQALAGAGHWIKLSGWYRLGAQAPYARLHAAIRQAHAWFGERMVWGSDWPHTAFAAGSAPAYDSVWTPVAQALDATQQRSVRCVAPAVLYGRPS